MVGKFCCTLAEECKRLCKDKERDNDVKEYSKFQKREENVKLN